MIQTADKSRGAFPVVLQVQTDNIPDILKRVSQWIVWGAGPLRANGKFDKIPIDPRSGLKINAHDPNNWLAFDDAIAAHRAGKGSGIGFVMSAAHTIQCNGEPYYLVALDFDHYRGRIDELREIGLQLGRPPTCTQRSGAPRSAMDWRRFSSQR